jgi:hypothetical protein
LAKSSFKKPWIVLIRLNKPMIICSGNNYYVTWSIMLTGCRVTICTRSDVPCSSFVNYKSSLCAVVQKKWKGSVREHSKHYAILPLDSQGLWPDTFGIMRQDFSPVFQILRHF